jgi:hypothetical protein
MLTRVTFGVFGLFFVLMSPAFGDNVNIVDIVAKSGNTYKDGGVIAVGSEVFFDKEVTMLEVPDEIKGAQFIKGWNEDAGWHFNNPLDPVDKIFDDQKNFLKIVVDRAVRLWILFDRSNEDAIIANRKSAGDPWLWDGKKFEQTNIIASAKGSSIDFTVYRSKSIYPKGIIVLGALGSQGKIMYVPLVADAPQAVQPDGKLAAVWGGLKATQAHGF